MSFQYVPQFGIDIPMDGIKEINKMSREEDAERDVVEIIEEIKRLNSEKAHTND